MSKNNEDMENSQNDGNEKTNNDTLDKTIDFDNCSIKPQLSYEINTHHDKEKKNIHDEDKSCSKVIKSPIDIELIFQQNIGKIFGKAIATYILTNTETNYGYGNDDDDDDDNNDDEGLIINDIDDQFRSRYVLINEAIKALAAFIMNSSPESNRSLLDLYRAEKVKLTKIVTELAIEKYVDNPFKRAIIRHTVSGDLNIIPFLEQELKIQNPQLAASEAIRIVTRFKNDLINIFCSPILEIIINFSSDTNTRIDLYMAIVVFVENEYPTFMNQKDFSESNFRNLMYDLNLFYIQQLQQDKTKDKKNISIKDLEMLKNGHYKLSNNICPRLASNIYFKNDPLLSKLPIKFDTIYKIASFLASIKSMEEKNIFCQGTFGYVIFLLQQCLINESSANINYYQSLHDVDKYHNSFTNSLVDFEARFKKRLKKIKFSKRKKSGIDNDNDEDDDDENDKDDDDNDDDDSITYKNVDRNQSYRPVMVNNSYDKYYLAPGMFGDDSLFNKKLISLIEVGDIAGLQKLTKQVFDNANINDPFIVYYVQNLIDVISIQGERLKNMKLLNFESSDMPSSSSSSSSLLSSSSTSTIEVSKNKQDVFNDSMLAAREIAKSSIRSQYESTSLSNMNKDNNNVGRNNNNNYNGSISSKMMDNKLSMLIESMLETQTSAHSLFTDIFIFLLQRTFPNTSYSSGNSMIQNHIKTISPFGPKSVSSFLYAVEFVSVKRNIPRTLHLLKKNYDDASNSDTETMIKLNTAIESSLQDKSIAEAKKRIIMEAKHYLENNGATLINIMDIIMTEKDKNTVTTPYSLNSLMKGLLTILAQTVYITKLKNINANTSRVATDTSSGSMLVLMIIPEIIEWLVEYLASQIETVMTSFLQTKLPSKFDEEIYESNKSRITSTSTTDIGKLFTQLMANDYLTKIDSVLNTPHSDRYDRLREQLIWLVVDKSMNVLKKQCWSMTMMAIMIVIDHKRALTTNIHNINMAHDNDKSKLISYLHSLNTNTNGKKQLKEVISAVCLSVAKDTALSFARLSNSHFSYILQRFNIIPNNNNINDSKLTSRYHKMYKDNNKRAYNNTNVNNIDNRSFLIPKKRTKREHYKQPIKQNNVSILDGIINKYQNVSK
uniref:Wsv271-like protein n=1 Tax=Melicertus latisulcatus majanivirus TaxID=2984277 RepID=A0A9C7CEV9_9VIRU|nr:MAG: wsv271-like protein [Melicertus latisulcatus majanivirus]